MQCRQFALNSIAGKIPSHSSNKVQSPILNLGSMQIQETGMRIDYNSQVVETSTPLRIFGLGLEF